MAAYAILSGFKGEDSLGEEIARGTPLEMKAQMVEMSEGKSAFDLIEVVHSRRGRIGRRKPAKVAHLAKVREERAVAKRERLEVEAATIKANKISHLESEIETLKTGVTPDPKSIEKTPLSDPGPVDPLSGRTEEEEAEHKEDAAAKKKAAPSKTAKPRKKG